MADCSVCTNPLLGVVASMIDCQARPEEIADSTGLLVTDIEAHIALCCQMPAPVNTLQASDERLQTLQDRINVAITASGLQGDLRAQLSGLGLALRAEAELRRRVEDTEAKARPLPANRNEWTEEEAQRHRDYSDKIVADHAYLAQMTPAEVLALFSELDPASVEREMLREQLTRYVSCWLNLRSNIKPVPESWRLLNFHIAEMQRQFAKLESTVQ